VKQLVHTLPEREAVAGITSLACEIYLLRLKERDQVEVYDDITYRLRRCLTVPNARVFTDMTSCEHYRCVYIGDHIGKCIHRLASWYKVQGAVTRWAVNDIAAGLSVNSAHNVLVTCRYVRMIKEFSSYGNLLRKVTFPDDVTSLSHAIQSVHSGQFIVCHGLSGEPVHRVCVMSADGRQIVHSHGGQPGSHTGQYRGPAHLAVDDNEFVFVADVNNRRVTLLSPTLEYVRHAVSRDQLKGWPHKLYLDRQRRHLYVVENKWNETQRSFTAGHVVVFSV